MYTIEGRVGASQTGADGKMRLVAAIDMIQDCSLFWMESEPRFLAFMRQQGLGMFLQFRQVDVVRLPGYGENVRATTSIYACQSFYGHRNTVLYGADGTPCVLTWSIGVFVSGGTGRMARLPADIERYVTLDERVEMDYLPRRIPVPKTGGTRCEPYRVRQADVDLNRHMNNARYLEAAVELLPADFTVRRIRVEHKLPAVAGEVLCPTRFEAAGQSLILLDNAQGKPCAVMEFSP